MPVMIITAILLTSWSVNQGDSTANFLTGIILFCIARAVLYLAEEIVRWSRSKLGFVSGKRFEE